MEMTLTPVDNFTSQSFSGQESPREAHESPLETALTKQELNFQAELFERDGRIKELEQRLAQISFNGNMDYGYDLLNFYLWFECNVQFIHRSLMSSNTETDEYKSSLIIMAEEKRLLGSQFEQLTEDFRSVEIAFADIHG